MEILCRCPECNAAFKVDGKAAGRKARCPKCATVVAVPPAPPSAAPATPVSPTPASPGTPAAVAAPATPARQPASDPGSSIRKRFLESPPAAESTTALDFPELKTPPTGGIVLINPTPDSEPPAGPPVEPRATRSSAERANPSDSRNGISLRKSASAVTPPPTAPAEPAPAADDEPSSTATVSFTPRSRSSPSTKPRGNRRSSSLLYWVVGGGVAALLVAVACIFGVAAYFSGNSSALRSLTGKPILALNWPEADRKGAALTINGRDVSVDRPGPLEISLDEGTHRLTLRRRGFEQIDYGFTLRKGERHPFTPNWQKTPFQDTEVAGNPPSPPTKGSTKTGASGGNDAGSNDGGFSTGPLNFNGWLQSLEQAARRARERKKDIFLVFSGSDWSNDSIQMSTDIFAQAKFRQFAEPRFELVVIDLPRTEAGYNLLADVNQNRNLFQKFAIRTVPTVALLDAGGTPYAFDGLFRDGVDKYIQHVTLLQAKHNTRDARLAAVDAVKGKPAEQQIEACEAAVSWMRDEKVQYFYSKLLAQWFKLAQQVDPRNEQGRQEVFFEANWETRLRQAAYEQEQALAAALLVELAKWSESHKFTNPDRAVRLHMTAAFLLSRTPAGEVEAKRHLDLARSYTPNDADLKKNLDTLTKALQTSDQISSGTGFVIDGRGYILTNNHVIEGPGTTVVRLPGGNDRVVAEIVAQDPKRDIALLRVDPKRFARFEPVPFSTGKVSRAASVAVFGFPLGDDIGNDVRITTGVVSALPEQSDEGMLLLDCRINPGNSGGPVLNRSGNVIGMVTAKTDAGLGLDSYGMALPTKDLTTFLATALPDFVAPSPGNALPSKDWEQIDHEVEGSILMVLKIKK